MSRSIARYAIGLGVLALFVVGLLVYLLILASATKQDVATTKTATAIAAKLSDYTDAKGVLPSSLTAVESDTIPKTISYQKLSDTAYKFCVTYKSASSGFNANAAIGAVLTQGFSGGTNDTNNAGDTISYLAIDSVHHKGLNCQTITPYLSNSTDPSLTYGGVVDTKIGVPYTKNANGSYTVCGVQTDYFENEGHANSDVMASDYTISTTSISAPYTGASNLGLISANSQFFDEKCDSIKQTDIHKGDTVDMFDITSASSSATTIFLRRDSNSAS